jgi:hypothetical protein
VIQAFQECERRCATSIAVRREAQDRYNAELQARSRSTVWLTGCRSWYLDASGNKPRTVARIDRRLSPTHDASVPGRLLLRRGPRPHLSPAPPVGYSRQ